MARNTFLANMSHEIRTPLGVVLGFSELLANKGSDTSDSDRLNFVSVIKRNGQLLSTVVNDILDLSKIEAGKLEVEHIDTPIAELLEDISGPLNLMARAKGITLSISSEGATHCIVKSDPTRLRQILLNVIGNAIKFTTRGAVGVVVGFQNQVDGAKQLEFVVKDTGCGIDATDAQKLFASFSQADESTTRKFGGTGLGLALSRRLAQALGGDVLLVESAPGVGSTFKITIDPGKVWLQSDGKGEKDRVPFDNQVVFLERGKLHGLKILLVDDGEDNRLLISRFLTIAGAEVDVAENGREGMEKALTANYDVILMDIQMPVMDGYASVAALREKGYKKPILALTARSMKEEHDRCLKSGFDEHLSKPIERDELIGKVLGRSKKENHG